MSVGGQYVAAAYGVILVALLVYLVVLGRRTARLARETELLARLAERREPAAGAEPAPERELQRETT